MPPPHAQPSEADLVRQARLGDPGAFEALVRPHLGLFQRAIQRILGQDAEGEDALQDALVTLFRELPRFQEASRFSTWAYRVCVNQALMARRKRLRRREDSVDDLMPRFAEDGHHMDVDGSFLLSGPAEALVGAERAELAAKVREGLDLLSDDQRAVFVLRDLEGWETDEIGSHLGIPRELVRQRLHRARLALRGLLAPFAPHSGRRP